MKWEVGRRAARAGLTPPELAHRAGVDVKKVYGLLGGYLGEDGMGTLSHEDAVRLLADPALQLQPAELNAVLLLMRRARELTPREQFELATPADWRKTFSHHRSRLGDLRLVVAGQLPQLHPAGERPALEAFGLEAAEGALAAIRVSFAELLNHNLRPRRTSFIGREREQADLRELLTVGGLTTLWGAPGVGKTALASQLAASMLTTFSDGVWKIDLAGLHEPRLLVSALARALRIRDVGVPGAPNVVEGLRARHLLLLLDNCDHLAAATAALAVEILASCPRVSILATSRQSLEVSGEVLRHVAPLPTSPPHADLVALRGSEAVRLFVDRVQDHGGRPITDDQLPAVGDICDRLAGLPLAIELIAAQVRAASVAHIARTLDELVLRARGPGHGGDPRHISLDDAIGASFEPLPEDLRRAFLSLSVFRNGAPLRAIAAVLETENAEQGLGELVRRALVELDEDLDGSPRYLPLEPLRQFAAARLQSSDLASAARRHAMWFGALALTADELIYGEGGAEAFGRLAQEHDNLAAAVEYFIREKDALSAYRLGAALWVFWHRRGLWQEGRLRVEAILQLERPADPAAAAAVLRGAGALYRSLDNYDLAYSHLREALLIARTAGDRRAEAQSLLQLANTEMAQGLNDVAIVHMTEARDCYAAIGDATGAARAAGSTGLALIGVGRYAEAVESLTRSVTPLEAIGDRRNLAVVLNNLGLARLRLGEPAAAEPLFRRARDLFRESWDRRGAALAALNVGLALDDEGRAAEARAEYKFAVGEFSELRALRDIGAALDLVARHLARFGQIEGLTLVEGAAKVRESLKVTPSVAGQAFLDTLITPLRANAPFEARLRAETLGRTMTVDQLVSFAKEQIDQLDGQQAPDDDA